MIGRVGTRVVHQIQAIESVGVLGTVKLRTYPFLTRLFRSIPPLTLSPSCAKYPLTCRPHTSDQSAFCQVFVYREYACVDDLAHVDLVIDCGANVGFASAYFLSRFPGCSVIAVEPHHENFRLLEANLAPYGERVRSINSGVWSHAVGLKIAEEKYRDGREWSTQVRESRPEETPDMQEVRQPLVVRRQARACRRTPACGVPGARSAGIKWRIEQWPDAHNRAVSDGLPPRR